ncbi:MAG: NAD(P)-dependent oxidoreductase [Actinobacteria bacterium]|nr:NAD(P)-dependent oxidoreductase [Actinomycetota bacterium]
MTAGGHAPGDTAAARVAVLGIGRMGGAVVERLLETGAEVTVWNRSAEKTRPLAAAGARVAADPAAAAAQADAALLLLSDGPAVEHVLLEQGVAEAVSPGGLVVDMSSIPPASAQRHAARLAALGSAHLDAPVSGGVRGARAGTMTILAGGDEPAFARAAPLLERLGIPHHVGAAGAGQFAKCVNQIIVGITIAAVAEGLLLADAGGVDAASVRTALLGGFADSRILQEHGRRMVERDFVAGGMVATQLKDLRTALDVARAHGLTLPITERVTGLFGDAADHIGTEVDHAGVLLELERLNAARA